MTTLITGAGGFVGSHLAEALAARGEDIVCMLYSKDKKHLLDVEKMKLLSKGSFKVVTGDITNKKFVESVVKKCDRVYHLAAALNYSSYDLQEFLAINAGGTRNIMQASLDNGIEKVVHTSSVSTIFEKNSGKVDEKYFPKNFFDNPYSFTKYIAEKIAFEYGARGLNVSVVNPCLIYGSRESRGVGPMIKNYLERGVRFLAFSDTKFNLVYVGDVVDAHISAMKKGRKGHRYILGGHELTVKNFLKLVDDIAGVKKPVIMLPDKLVEVGINFAEPAMKAVGMKPPVTAEFIAALKKDMIADSSKARKELGLKITPLREGLEKTINWYKQTGYLNI